LQQIFIKTSTLALYMYHIMHFSLKVFSFVLVVSKRYSKIFVSILPYKCYANILYVMKVHTQKITQFCVVRMRISKQIHNFFFFVVYFKNYVWYYKYTIQGLNKFW